MMIGVALAFTIAFSECALGIGIRMPLEDQVVNSDLIIIAQVINVETGKYFYVMTPPPAIAERDGKAIGLAYGSWNWMLAPLNYSNDNVMGYLNRLQELTSEMQDKTNWYGTVAVDREIDRHLQRHVATCLVQEELKSTASTSTVSLVFFIESVGIHSTASPRGVKKGKQYILFLKRVGNTYEMISPYQGDMEVEPKYIDTFDFKDGKPVTTWIKHEDFLKKVRGIVKKTGDITKPSSLPR